MVQWAPLGNCSTATPQTAKPSFIFILHQLLATLFATLYAETSSCATRAAPLLDGLLSGSSIKGGHQGRHGDVATGGAGP